MSNEQIGGETYDRVLAAATEVFAEVGYRGATLREICRRGRANIAAVNYHFRDKEQLYAEVLNRAVGEADESFVQTVPNTLAPAEDRLRHFVYAFLRELLGADRHVQLLRLFTHEMIEPTPALAMALEKIARPLKGNLAAIIAELLGPAAADAALVRDCAASVMSQCVSYQHSEACVRLLDGLDVHDPATIEHLADHVFRFSLAAIRGLAGQCQSSLEKVEAI
jgi:AcrR family transcriptional regulator